VLYSLIPLNYLLADHAKAGFPSRDGIVYDLNNPLVSRGQELENTLYERIKLAKELYDLALNTK
jgi:hypothetical protein